MNLLGPDWMLLGGRKITAYSFWHLQGLDGCVLNHMGHNYLTERLCSSNQPGF